MFSIYLLAAFIKLDGVETSSSLHQMRPESHNASELGGRAGRWLRNIRRQNMPYRSNYNDYYKIQQQDVINPYNEFLRSKSASIQHKLGKVVKGKGTKRDDGPKRGPRYDPSYGYEPYWAGGHWVFNWWHNEVSQNKSDLCDLSCPDIYSYFGMICGRNRLFESKQFDDYCDMKEMECHDHSGWYIVYRGQCREPIPTLGTFPIEWRTDALISRATYILEEYAKRAPGNIPL